MKASSLVTIAFSAVAMLATPAVANEVQYGNSYAKLSGGILLMEDVSNGGAKLSFDTGWMISGAVGTYFSKQFAVEAELSYFSADFDKASVGAASAPIDGDFQSFLAMVNAYLHPMQGNSFSPYFGAGIGASFAKVEVNRIGVVPVNMKDDGTDLALQGLVGFDIDLGAGQKLGAQYRYIWTDTGGGGVDDLTGHGFTLNFSVPF